MGSDNRNNYIVNEPIIKIRVLTSQLMVGNTKKYIMGIVLFFLLTEAIANILGILIPASYTAVMNVDLPAEVAQQMPSLPYSSVIYTLMMLGAFEFGRTLYQLTFLRNGTFNYEFIFEGFSNFFKVFMIQFLRSLLTTVGMFLFIVPGVIAIYYYRQAFFILADDPKKGVIQCMRESRQMMEGNKMSLFRLDFSFLLMFMLANFPATLVQTMVENNIYGVIVYTIARLPIYIVLGNMYLNRTVFYELLAAKGFSNFKYKNEAIFRNVDQSM